MRRLLSTLLLVSALGLTMSVDTLGQPLWTKDARNPIMSGGGAGSWDKNLDFPFVLFNPDSGRYEMWYTGFQIPEPSLSQIGFAWSIDGISWTKHPGNPVLSLDAGQWDGEIVDRAMVLREDGAYKMWYRGRPDRAIGYATSPDGIQWTKHPGNPVFTGGPSSWETYTAWCTVTRGSTDYTMWYTGLNVARDKGSIGRATSPDGMQWQRDTVHNPLLSPGPTGSWDDGIVGNPSVFAVGNTMFMLYEGRPASGNPPWQVGLARSMDGGMTWTKESANPVLRRGAAGSWDADYVGLGSVLLAGDTCHIWYSGSRENTAVNLWKVGHATEPLADILVSVITATPQVVDFGQVLVGASSDTVEVEVKNGGPHTLTVNSIVLDGMVFSLSNVPSLPAALAPSDSLAFGVFFHPAVHGNVDASVVVGTSDSLHPALRVALKGRGLQYGPELRQLVDRVNTASYPNRPAIVDSFLTEHPVMPLIEIDSMCQFLYRGNAATVYMAGEANGWSAEASPMMRLSTTDAWILSDVYEQDARLEYKFVVNGTDWILDPRNPATCTGGFGPNSELAMPSYVHAPELQYYPDIPHGELHDTSFSSTILGNMRTIRVYTPPGYSQAGSDSFEVAVLHDGLEWLNYAEGDNALDYLIHHNRVRPLIAVFVPPVNREPEYIGAQQDEFAAFISTELMPYVDARYRTQRRPMSRATAGISNGGNIALWIMAQYPQEFGNAASYSGAVQPRTASVLDAVPTPSCKVYLDVGTYDLTGFLELSRDFRDMLQARGYDYRYIEWHEGHSWGSWGAHLDNALEYFFPGTAVGMQEEHPTPTAFTLSQNYPNPFNPSTTIRYGVPVRSHVTLTIFNTLGQQVATLIQGEQEAGYHEAKFDASRLASGVYLYRLTAGEHVQARKLILLR